MWRCLSLQCRNPDMQRIAFEARAWRCTAALPESATQKPDMIYPNNGLHPKHVLCKEMYSSLMMRPNRLAELSGLGFSLDPCRMHQAVLL